MNERAYERHAWILLFVMGLLLLMAGLFFIGGGGEDVAAVRRSRNYQVMTVGFALFGIAISLKSYRRGERWAWYAMWYFPLAFGIIAANFLVTEDPLWPAYAAYTVISLLGLLLPYRKFFPK